MRAAAKIAASTAIPAERLTLRREVRMARSLESWQQWGRVPETRRMQLRRYDRRVRHDHDGKAVRIQMRRRHFARTLDAHPVDIGLERIEVVVGQIVEHELRDGTGGLLGGFEVPG